MVKTQSYIIQNGIEDEDDFDRENQSQMSLKWTGKIYLFIYLFFHR